MPQPSLWLRFCDAGPMCPNAPAIARDDGGSAADHPAPSTAQEDSGSPSPSGEAPDTGTSASQCPNGQKPCGVGCIGAVDVCETDCGAAKNRCGGACVDATSITACGPQCATCPTSPNGKTTCDGTQCVLTCNTGFHRCGDGCVPSDSADSCGSSCVPCTKATGGDAACVSGACQATCPSNLVLCKTTGSCLPPGQICGDTCPAGKHDCGGNCVPETDVNSCGTSCMPCPVPPNADAVCNADKTCGFQCHTGFHACGNECKPDNSTASCGSSCNPCPVPTGGKATCTNNACGVDCGNLRNCNGSCKPCCDGDIGTCKNNCNKQGNQTCSGGSWGSCSVPKFDCCAPAERCTGTPNTTHQTCSAGGQWVSDGGSQCQKAPGATCKVDGDCTTNKCRGTKCCPAIGCCEDSDCAIAGQTCTNGTCGCPEFTKLNYTKDGCEPCGGDNGPDPNNVGQSCCPDKTGSLTVCRSGLRCQAFYGCHSTPCGDVGQHCCGSDDNRKCNPGLGCSSSANCFKTGAP